MNQWKKKLLTICLFSSITFPSTLLSEEISRGSNETKAMLVLDASGSMWGQIDGKAKISVAREVISEIVNDWDQDASLGLIAYGHNKKGDCKDIELLQQPKKIDKASFLQKINKLNPKGKTPLSAAVKQAAETLHYTREKATVVLISDGKETCNLDPCDVGRSLNKAGVDFTAHVISFDVPDNDSAGLRCLARETGGIFLEADNADELKKALSETSKMVTDKAALKISEALVKAPLEVVAGSQFNAIWKGPKNRLDKLIIKSTDDKRQFGSVYIGREDVSSPSKMKAPETPGEYFIHYQLRDKRSLAKTKLKVIPAKASVSSVAEVVAGSEFEVEWTGPKNRFDVIGVFKPDGKSSLSRTYIFREQDKSPAVVRAPEQPGSFEVRYFTHGKKTLAKQTVVAVPASARVKAPQQVVAGAEFDVEWHGPKNKFDLVAVFKIEGNKKLDSAYVFREKDKSPATISAPEEQGTYEVRYYTHGKKTLAKQSISVIPATAKVSAPEQVVAGSAFEVEWQGPKNKFDLVAVFKIDGNKKLDSAYVFREKDSSPATISAPEEQGTYEVRYYTHGKKTLAKQSISVIAASASVSAPSRVKAGTQFSVDWKGPKNKFDTLIVFSRDGKKKYAKTYIRPNSKSPIQLNSPKKPGQYQVRYFTKGKNTLASQNFEVF